MDYNIEDMLNSARKLQKTYYKVDDVLMQRLASGCMANLAQAMHLDWKIITPYSSVARAAYVLTNLFLRQKMDMILR